MTSSVCASGKFLTLHSAPSWDATTLLLLSFINLAVGRSHGILQVCMQVDLQIFLPKLLGLWMTICGICRSRVAMDLCLEKSPGRRPGQGWYGMQAVAHAAGPPSPHHCGPPLHFTEIPPLHVTEVHPTPRH